MRATQHNGRAGKHGVYSAKHNDRKFEVENAEHIDAERSDGNRYWQWDKTAGSFEEAEARFYEQHFSESLEQRNASYERQRHAERCQTMEDYRKNEKSCPEETILQVGKEGQTIDSDLLWKIAVDQINWEQKQYPNCKLLDVALHVDEQGAPHIHERKVWIGHDSHGQEVVGQAKALKEMGIEAPDPSKKISRTNNPKQTYSRECREHLLEVCRSYGLEIETEPLEPSKSGLSLLEYQRQQEQEKIQQLEHQQEQMQQQIAQQQHQIKQMQAEKEKVDKSIKASQKALKTAQKELEGVQGKQQELEGIKSKIATAQKELETTLDMKARASEIKKPLFHKFGDSSGTVTYNENMLDNTRAIGRQAREHMEKASAKMQKVAEREKVVSAKEKEIEPLHKEAKSLRDEAEKYKDDLEGFIIGTAHNIVDKELSKAMSTDDYQKRMEEHMKGISYNDGTTVFDSFKEQEHIRAEKIKQELEAKAQRIAKSRSHDWGLSL